MRSTRKCEFCVKTFVSRSGMQKYCCEECQAEAKRLRKKRQQDLINGIEPIMDLQHQEYLTFSKAAILMGCTRQYIYKLVANGKLKSSRLSSRMAFVRKSDIEKMFEGNPYKRVIPKGKSWLSQRLKQKSQHKNRIKQKGKRRMRYLTIILVRKWCPFIRSRSLGSTPPPNATRYQCVVLLARTITANGILMSFSVLPLTSPASRNGWRLWW